MKPSCLAVGLALGLGATTAQAELPAQAAEGLVPNDATQSETTAAGSGGGTPVAPTSAAENVASQPTGELVRIAKLPQAELMVNVTIASNDDLAYFEVDSDKTGASLLICGNPCSFRIWPGRYRLLTNASAGYIGGNNLMTVERDAQVQVKQPRLIRPILGAILGTLGVASAAVGGFLLATNHCESPCERQMLTHHQIGFATLGAGLVIAPVGWMIFGQSRKPDLTVVPQDLGHGP